MVTLFSNTTFVSYNSGKTEKDDGFPIITIIQIVLYVLIIIIGTVGNVLVCRAVALCKRKRTNEYFILNLSVTDLGASLISVPLDLAELIQGRFPFGRFLCNFVYPFQTLLMAVSVLTLLFMSLERYRVIATPLKRRIPSNIARISIVSSWILSLGCIVPYALVLGFENGECTETWGEDSHRKVYTFAIFFMFYLIPLFIMALAYTQTVKTLFRELKKVCLLVGGKDSRVCDMAKRRAEQNLRMVKIFVIAVVAFAVCLLPTHVSWLWHDYGGGNGHKYFNIVIAFSNIMIYSNSAINPFIFGKVNLGACLRRKSRTRNRRSSLLGSYKAHAFMLRTRGVSFSLTMSFRNSFRSSTKRTRVSKECKDELSDKECESQV